MPTVLNKLKITPNFGPAAPEVERKLQVACAHLETLQAQHGPLALDAELNAPGAADRLTTLEREIAPARTRVATLKAAHAAAVARDQTTLEANRASLRRAQIKSLTNHLTARDIAATKLAAALAEAAPHWKEMIEAGKRAMAATPVSHKWPDDGGLATFDGLHRLVSYELYRLTGGNALLGSRAAFPGAVPDNLDHQGQPEKIKPLVEMLADNSVFVAETFGKAPVT